MSQDGKNARGGCNLTVNRKASHDYFVLEKIEADGVFQAGAWRVAKRGKVAYQNGRFTYDCLAIAISDVGRKGNR